MDYNLLVSIVSVFVTAVIPIVINRVSRHSEIQKELSDILDIAIEYPYLEAREWTQTWKPNTDRLNDEEKERHYRYEAYCTRVFNFLEKVYKFYSFDKAVVENELDVKNWVKIHKEYWYNPTVPNENSGTYNAQMVKIIEGYLNE